MKASKYFFFMMLALSVCFAVKKLSGPSCFTWFDVFFPLLLSLVVELISLATGIYKHHKN